LIGTSVIGTHLIGTHLVRTHLVRTHLVRTHLVRTHLIGTIRTVLLWIVEMVLSLSVRRVRVHSRHFLEHHRWLVTLLLVALMRVLLLGGRNRPLHAIKRRRYIVPRLGVLVKTLNRRVLLIRCGSRHILVPIRMLVPLLPFPDRPMIQALIRLRPRDPVRLHLAAHIPHGLRLRDPPVAPQLLLVDIIGWALRVLWVPPGWFSWAPGVVLVVGVVIAMQVWLGEEVPLLRAREGSLVLGRDAGILVCRAIQIGDGFGAHVWVVLLGAMLLLLLLLWWLLGESATRHAGVGVIVL
jgi:hypothetical protein